MEEKNNLISWPPAFTFKRHSRARHVKLKASPHQGLEIVAPLRFNLKHIPEILEANKSWIIKRLLEIQHTSGLLESLPEIIHLYSCNQIWKIQYIKTTAKKVKLMIRVDNELVMLGNTDNKKMCIQLIVAWVKQYAQKYLLQRIEMLSQKTGLTYNSVMIRSQRTRWGSCTSTKNISLNYKLVFLPEKLVDHIIIHELCHTIHLNHSARFWRLVASFDPAWQQNTREVRATEIWVPVWT